MNTSSFDLFLFVVDPFGCSAGDVGTFHIAMYDLSNPPQLLASSVNITIVADSQEKASNSSTTSSADLTSAGITLIGATYTTNAANSAESTVILAPGPSSYYQNFTFGTSPGPAPTAVPPTAAGSSTIRVILGVSISFGVVGLLVGGIVSFLYCFRARRQKRDCTINVNPIDGGQPAFEKAEDPETCVGNHASYKTPSSEEATYESLNNGGNGFWIEVNGDSIVELPATSGTLSRSLSSG